MSYAEVRDDVPKHIHFHFHLLTPHAYADRDPLFTSLWRIALGEDHDTTSGVRVEGTRNPVAAARYGCGFDEEKRWRPLFRTRRECGFEISCGTPLFAGGMSYSDRRVEREIYWAALERFPTDLDAPFSAAIDAAVAHCSQLSAEWAATRAKGTS